MLEQIAAAAAEVAESAETAVAAGGALEQSAEQSALCRPCREEFPKPIDGDIIKNGPLEHINKRPGQEKLPGPEIPYEKRPDINIVYERPGREELPRMARPERTSDVQPKTMLPRTEGKWSGEAGNSDWHPNPESIPPDKNGTNPEHKTWEEILKEYNIDHIPYKDGYPDFSEICKGQVEIDDFTDNRKANFTQADEKLAEQRGCTPEEVKKWREEHGYTWHECEDCRTMQKVPTEVHGNVSHSGGISVYKSQHRDT